MFIDDPFRDCRLKPVADVRVQSEVSLFVQTHKFAYGYVFNRLDEPQQAMFDIMVENRGEA